MKQSLFRKLVVGGFALVTLNTVAAHPTDLQTTPTPTMPPVSSITLSGHTSAVTALAWSLDGSTLASSAGYFDSQDNVVRLWQSDGHEVAELSEHTAPVDALAWSKDSQILATGSQDQSIKLWQKDGTLLQTIQTKAGIVFALSWSQDRAILASGSVASPTQNTVQLWSTEGKLLNTMTTQFSGGKFYNLGESSDGKYLVGGATDYSEWKADGTLVFSHESCAHCPPAWGFAWSPDSKMWAIGNESGLLWVYGVDGQQIAQLQSTEGIDAIQWSPDGKWMAAGKDLWQVNGTQFVLKNYLKGTSGPLAWSPDSRFIASVADNVVYIQQADGTLVGSLKGHTNQIRVLAWSPNGNILASGANDHTIRLWDLTNLDP